jgi:hypothetical protein
MHVRGYPLAGALALLFSSAACEQNPNCPICGTVLNGTVGIIDVIPVPEHNPTGEPGGPFNSFDISWVDTPTHRDYVSDRIGLDIVVVDTVNDIAVNAIGGDNSVSSAQLPSPCDPSIPPMRLDVLGQPEAFGCRGDGNFGGFPGAACCASRANGVNPLSAPDGNLVTPDGKTLFVGNADSAVVVFDLTTTPPTVIADVPTGQSATWNGPEGVGPCITSSLGRGFNDPTCGDLRADEISYDPVDKIVLVTNGDPGVPFATFIDMSGVVDRTSHCLPQNPTEPYSAANPPTACLTTLRRLSTRFARTHPPRCQTAGRRPPAFRHRRWPVTTAPSLRRAWEAAPSTPTPGTSFSRCRTTPRIPPRARCPRSIRKTRRAR